MEAKTTATKAFETSANKDKNQAPQLRHLKGINKKKMANKRKIKKNLNKMITKKSSKKKKSLKKTHKTSPVSSPSTTDPIN